MFRILVVFAGLALFAPVCSAESFDDVRDYIRTVLNEQSVPSIAVAVAKGDRIIWEEGFGWADREQRIPATEHTMYSLASTSKPITTTGLMTLVQAGKVDLDAPANDYLGNAKLRARVGDARQATVRRVADHTAGLPRHAHVLYADEPYRRPSMDDTILRYGHLMTAPGEKYQYSNLGYGVLDYIIERVSGLSYAEFMRREVFIPLGLTRTSVDIGPGLEAHAATRYGVDGLPIPRYTFDHPGASAVYGSAHDVARFAQFHLKAHLRDQKAILSDALIDQMHRNTARDMSDGSPGYGIGFMVNERHGYRYVDHAGGMGGVSTQMLLFPGEQLAIVVLSNAATSPTRAVAERIAGKLLPNWKMPRREERPAPVPFVASPELQGSWKGVLSTYAGDLPLELHIGADGDVRAKVGRQPTALVDSASFKDGEFGGVVVGHVGTPDTAYYADRIQFSLKLRGNVLNGSALAVDGYEQGYYYPRWRSALPHWVELNRQLDPAAH